MLINKISVRDTFCLLPSASYQNVLAKIIDDSNIFTLESLEPKLMTLYKVIYLVFEISVTLNVRNTYLVTMC